MLDEVAVLGSRAKTALAAATLARVSRYRSTLDVTAVSNSDRDVFVRDQIFDRKLDTFVDDLGAPLVAKIFLNLFQFLRNNSPQRSLVAENLFELGDKFDYMFVLVKDLLP